MSTASGAIQYSHLAISVTQSNQMHVLTEKEAKFRLAKSLTRTSNRDVLDGIRGGTSVSSGNTTKSHTHMSKNQVVLATMKGSSATTTSRTSGAGYKHSVTKAPSSSNCFIATAVYGIDAAETNLLRKWRDEFLLTSAIGRMAVVSYYKISPRIVPILENNPRLLSVVRTALNQALKYIK